MEVKEMQGTEQMREKLRQHMEAEGLSLRVIAPQINVSFGALGPWMNGTYGGTSDNVTKKVMQYFERKAEVAAMPVSEAERFPVTVETAVFTSVHRAIRECHLKGKIGVVTTNSGTGKTTAVRNYCEQNSGSILIECHHSFPARMVLGAIATACGVENRGSIHELLTSISDKLRNSGRVILLDEAEHLKPPVLDVVRRIHDWAGIGIVYIGLPRFMVSLQSIKRDFDYIWNRVRVKANIERNRTTELADITGLLASMLEEVIDGIAETFYTYCKGDIRKLEYLFFSCLETSRFIDTPITRELIITTANRLKMEVIV